jgi:hypothetical protein
MKALDCGMTNLQASKIGRICLEVGQQTNGIGDSIDRGLVLRRRLEESGFIICIKEQQ